MEKSKLLAQTLNLLLAKTTLSETEIETEIPDNLMMFLNKFTEEFPELKRMLIDERTMFWLKTLKQHRARRWWEWLERLICRAL